MKHLVPIVLLLSLFGCVSNHTWRIDRSTDGGKTYLVVTRPGERFRHTVVKSPYDIPNYAISADGRYIAYISWEHKEKGPELFIQNTGTGLRVNWTPVQDILGQFQFNENRITYVSKLESLVVNLGDVETKLEELRKK